MRSCWDTGTAAGPLFTVPPPVIRTVGPVTASASSGRHLKAYEPLPSVTRSGRTVPGASPSTSP